MRFNQPPYPDYRFSSGLKNATQMFHTNIPNLPRVAVEQDDNCIFYQIQLLNSNKAPVGFRFTQNRYNDFVEDIAYIMEFIDYMEKQISSQLRFLDSSSEDYKETEVALQVLIEVIDRIMELGYVSLGREIENYQNDILIGRLKDDTVEDFMKQSFIYAADSFYGNQLMGDIGLHEGLRVHESLKFVPLV